MVDKWEFMQGNEVVYSSALDVTAPEENVAWKACVQAVGDIFERWGWMIQLNQITEQKMMELVMTTTLEFEKVMKAEKAKKQELFDDGNEPF